MMELDRQVINFIQKITESHITWIIYVYVFLHKLTNSEVCKRYHLQFYSPQIISFSPVEQSEPEANVHNLSFYARLFILSFYGFGISANLRLSYWASIFCKLSHPVYVNHDK